MARLIDADALKENCYKKMDELMESTSEHLPAEALSILCGFTLIDSAPTIDAVSVVRCKECVRRKNNGFCLEHNRYEKNDNGYCNYGERSSDEQ